MCIRILTMLVLCTAIELCVASSVPAKAVQRGDRLSGVAKVDYEKSPDAELERAILRTLRDYRPEPGQEVRYYYNRVDLNGDGKQEVIVHLVSPLICGTGGCETLIFQPVRSGGYRLVSAISLTNTPVIVSTRKTRGWNDLVIYVVGGGITRGYYATLRFNGRTYPNNATDAPALPARARISGTAYISGEVAPASGITLRYGGR